MTSNTKTLLWIAGAGVLFYLLYSYTKSGKSQTPTVGAATNTSGTGTNNNSGDWFATIGNLVNTGSTLYNDAAKSGVINNLFGSSSAPSPSTNSGGNNQGAVPNGSNNASQNLSDLIDLLHASGPTNTLTA